MKPLQILDAGCGQGRWTKQLLKKFPNAKIIALDHKRRLPEIKGVKYIEGSLEKLSLPDNHFDLVIAGRVLPYVDMKTAIKELERVTKNEGLLVYELMQVGYYIRKMLRGSPKRIVNFINWWFYTNFESKLFKKYDNIDSLVMIRYYSNYEIAEKFPLEYWAKLPVYSLLFMNKKGKILEKLLHNKLKNIATKTINQDT